MAKQCLKSATPTTEEQKVLGNRLIKVFKCWLWIIERKTTGEAIIGLQGCNKCVTFSNCTPFCAILTPNIFLEAFTEVRGSA